MGSRSGASGVGNVRGPGSGGGGVASVVDDATEAAMNAAMNEYHAILKVQQEALRAVAPVAIYGNTRLDMAFQQANAIWVSRHGTPPPGNLGGKFTWGK
jgi:hypothetical protein